MVKQKIIKDLGYGCLVRSKKGNTYEAVFKSKVMELPENATYVNVEFEQETPVITRFIFPPPEPPKLTHEEELAMLEEQEKEFAQLGGDY